MLLATVQKYACFLNIEIMKLQTMKLEFRQCDTDISVYRISCA